MKKWETMTINGESFEVNTVDLEVENNIRGYGGIYGAYDNPSIYKKDIWQYWYRWFIQHDGDCDIVSRNCMQFSIAGYVTDEDTKERYYCYITKAHNKAWKVVNG